MEKITNSSRVQDGNRKAAATLSSATPANRGTKGFGDTIQSSKAAVVVTAARRTCSRIRPASYIRGVDAKSIS